MAKYILQLRRGTKEEWAAYQSLRPDEAMPRAGELVLEYDNGIPRLKIGDGTTPYDKLPYMSIDSFVLPKSASITLYADRWEQAEDNRYFQVVTVDNAVITENSKIDLQLSSEQISIFHEKDLAFVAENEDGVVSVFCVGQVPTNNYTIQAVVTEVLVNG